MTIRKPAPKAAVQLIRSAFASATASGSVFSTKDAYNLLARLDGYKNWAHANATMPATLEEKETPKLGLTEEEVIDWATFVIYMDFGENDCDEDLYVMPVGSTLRNRALPRNSWLPFEEEGSVLLENLFEAGSAEDRADLRLRSFVVREVFSKVPRIERYGLPTFANELGVKAWILEDLGWNYLAYLGDEGMPCSSVEVTASDSGDDGSARYWMEVSVAPKMAKQLEKLLAAKKELSPALETTPTLV
jgi:hypothetical protein